MRPCSHGAGAEKGHSARVQGQVPEGPRCPGEIGGEEFTRKCQSHGLFLEASTSARGRTKLSLPGIEVPARRCPAPAAPGALPAPPGAFGALESLPAPPKPETAGQAP